MFITQVRELCQQIFPSSKMSSEDRALGITVTMRLWNGDEGEIRVTCSRNFNGHATTIRVATTLLFVSGGFSFRDGFLRDIEVGSVPIDEQKKQLVAVLEEVKALKTKEHQRAFEILDGNKEAV